MKILITGSSGLLGSYLFEFLKMNGESVKRFNRDKLSYRNNQTNIDQLIGFDCIIHAAANTNVEACEIDPISCYKDNTLLTERLAYAAGKAKCKFIYISSTGIYGTGKKSEPFTEYDEVKPTTHHHKSKWLAEKAVLKYANNCLILRAGWIFGGNYNNPKNFVARRIEEALSSKDKKIKSNNQQIGAPTFVKDFVVKLYELMKNNEYGTFNLVNQGYTSRYEYVKKIIEIAKIDVQVVPIKAGFFNRIARVSENESAIALKISQLGYKLLPTWQESLEKYIYDDLSDWIYKIKN